MRVMQRIPERLPSNTRITTSEALWSAQASGAVWRALPNVAALAGDGQRNKWDLNPTTQRHFARRKGLTRLLTTRRTESTRLVQDGDVGRLVRTVQPSLIS